MLFRSSLSDVIHIGLLNRNYVSSNPDMKISLNLYKFYEDVIISNNDTQPGEVNLSNFIIIQGNALTTNDGLVTIEDEHEIYNNVNKNNNPKKHFSIFALHNLLDTNKKTKSIINKLVNKQELNFYERNINLINESG